MDSVARGSEGVGVREAVVEHAACLVREVFVTVPLRARLGVHVDLVVEHAGAAGDFHFAVFISFRLQILYYHLLGLIRAIAVARSCLLQQVVTRWKRSRG